MNRENLDKFFERGILALVLSILVFAPLAKGAVEPWSILVVQALTMGVLLLWALRLWFSPKPQLLWPPICWVVLAFVLYAIVRWWTADIEYVARQELIQVLICAFLFFAIVNNLYRQEFSQVISLTMIFLAMGISGYAIFQFVTHTYRVWNEVSPYPGRGSGTYVSPNDFAGFLEMLLPLAVAYVLAGRMKITTRIFVAYAALVMVAGLMITFSRGGWVAALVGVLALLLVLLGHRSSRVPAAIALALILIGGGFFVEHYLSKSLMYAQRVDTTVQDGQVNLDYRRDMWHAATQMWLGHFWFGVGPAHYNYLFREYRPARIQRQPDRAHNDYLNLLADWGTTGGIIVLAGMAVFATGLWQTRNNVRRTDNTLNGSGLSNRNAFFLGAACALLALAVHSFVDFNLHIPANAILGITLLALLTSNLRFTTEGYWLNLRIPMKVFATFVLVIGFLGLGWQEWRGVQETYWTARGQNPQLLLPDRVAFLKKAFAAEPQNPDTAYNLGEFYRVQSFNGDSNYEQEAQTAMEWYARAMKLNPYDGYNYLRTGMCLDWLGRFSESWDFYSKAESLDPNGYYTVANIGWHYIQIGDYAAANEWIQRSLRLEEPKNNQIAGSYAGIIQQKLIDNASGNSHLPPGF